MALYLLHPFTWSYHQIGFTNPACACSVNEFARKSYLSCGCQILVVANCEYCVARRMTIVVDSSITIWSTASGNSFGVMHVEKRWHFILIFMHGLTEIRWNLQMLVLINSQLVIGKLLIIIWALPMFWILYLSRKEQGPTKMLCKFALLYI